MVSTTNRTLDLVFRDISGQRRVPVTASADASVGELTRSVAARMHLRDADVDGNPMQYQAHVEPADGIGRLLNQSERVGDALCDRDEVVLQQDIDAGAARRTDAEH